METEAQSAFDAVRIAGLKSVAMLDYLERTGVFVPACKRRSGRGTRRRYEFRDLLVLRVIATLLKNGASVSVIKDALVEFQAKSWSADRASLAFGDQKIRYLFVSGKHILFATSGDSIFDITQKGQMNFNFMVDLDGLHSDVCSRITQSEFEFLRGRRD